MEFVPIKIPQCSENRLVDDLVREIGWLDKNETTSSIISILQNKPTVKLTLLDFFNDIQFYKNELDEIKKVQESVANLQNRNDNPCYENINSATRTKYFLVHPINLCSEKLLSPVSQTFEDLPKEELSKDLSVPTIFPSPQSNYKTKTVKSPKSKKCALKRETPKRIVIAKPEVVEFRNCEAHKTYQKKVHLHNIDTQLTRFSIESRQLKSSFTVFVESNWDLIAPGMYVNLIVQFECDGLSEPEETLVICVQNGQSVVLTMRMRRDPPILQAQTCSTLSFSEQSSECTLLSSTLQSSSIDDSLSKCSGSLSTSERTSSGNLPRDNQNCSSFDCKKCFVGEFVMISTLVKNIGGKGRFFTMSETDWCLLKIRDITVKNMLIVPPFATWPAYFVLDHDELLILYTYFYPESDGLQVDEFYLVSDNCSVRTIEVIGDGIVLDRQSLQFNNKVEYQCFQTKKDEFCTIRYMDLGVGESNSFLGGTFTVTSKCDLDVDYRWEVSDSMPLPSIYKKTIGLGKTNFPVSKMSIEPTTGVFHANSVITFHVIADLASVKHDRYRTSLRLIIEDLPRAAVPDRFAFPCIESQKKRRLCENPVDVNFENIDVRFKCESISVKYFDPVNGTIDELNIENTLQTTSLADVTNIVDDSQFWQSAFLFRPDAANDQDSLTKEEVCRFIRGCGTCDCCQATMISTAVLRVGSPLFLGIESKFTAILCNRSSKRIKYWWSQPVGSDHSKMKIKIEPPYGSIEPESLQAIKLKCLPLETGNVASIFIPCQFNARNPLILSIECVVQSLCVTFYFPPAVNEFDMNYARIEWNANEYVSKYDKKTNKIKLISMKLREEQTLHLVKLNSSHSLEKPSPEKDYSDYHEYEGDFSSFQDNIMNDKIKQEEITDDDLFLSRDFLDDLFSDEADSFDDVNECSTLLPYFDWYTDLIQNQFRYQPLVYEFEVHPYQTAKKRIYIQNKSPIASYFRIYIKNFWPRHKVPDEQNMLLDTNALPSGFELRIEPSRGEIKSNETMFFDLIANSTTWGVYTDQITIEIDYLPPFVFWIRVINDDLPITFPIYKDSGIKIPNINFTAFDRGYPLKQRKLLLENTSDIPLFVNWHCFLQDEDDVDEKPFNVVLDMVSPFIDITELLMANANLIDAIIKYINCAYDHHLSKEDLMENRERQDSTDSCDNLLYGNSVSTPFSSMNVNSKLTCSSSESSSIPTSNEPIIRNDESTEFHVSIVPYYGQQIFDLFIITPKELFLPPKSKQYIYIDVNTETLKQDIGKVCCKACGFIRIAPVFKYSDNIYYRKDGYFLPPIEVDVSCEVRRPKFFIQSNKTECTFEFFTKHFVQQVANELQMKKKIMFKNFDSEVLNVTFKIDKPFTIKKISMESEVLCSDCVSIEPSNNVEIEIECAIDKNWLEEVMSKRECDIRNVDPITFNRRLKIIYKEGFCQYHELYIKITFPSLIISTTCLNFEKVCPGERKVLLFEIQNVSKLPQIFKLERTVNAEHFILHPTKALLAGRNVTGMDRLQITASFLPRTPGDFKETVRVISEVDGLVFYCTLEGSS